MWIKPIPFRLELRKGELRLLRICVRAEIAEQEKSLRKLKPQTARYSGIKITCDKLTSLKTKLNRALDGVQ